MSSIKFKFEGLGWTILYWAFVVFCISLLGSCAFAAWKWALE